MPGRSPLPPLWKIKREALRIGRQIDDLLYRKFSISSSLLFARLFVDPRVVHRPGALQLGQRVAVYLIYSRDGVLPSHEIALNYLIRCGYSPVVVSNLPLSPDDLERLYPLTANVTLRPNFGYDFGGYRDALLYLAPHLAALDHLALFNDSCWFPAQPQHNWLAEAEQMGRDFVGSVFHVAFPLGGQVDGTRTTWQDVMAAPSLHYGSFSLLIGKRPLSDPGFLDFWRNYRMTSNKDATVRRGEHGLTNWMIAHGYTHGATCDTTHLDTILADLPLDRLMQIAASLMTNIVPDREMKLTSALANPDRAQIISLILTFVAIQGPAYTMADYDTKERGGNFIKKAPAMWSPFTAAQTHRLLESLPSSEARTFLAEARALSDQKFGPRIVQRADQP